MQYSAITKHFTYIGIWSPEQPSEVGNIISILPVKNEISLTQLPRTTKMVAEPRLAHRASDSKFLHYSRLFAGLGPSIHGVE